MTTSYPPDARSGLWAWDVCKLLLRQRVAKRVGSSAAVLIIEQVAAGEHREDYLTPPAFWNRELMDGAGIIDDEAFSRARSKAITSGWLFYQKGDIREAGIYWVTIPKWAVKAMGSGACHRSNRIMTGAPPDHDRIMTGSSPDHDRGLSLPSPSPYPSRGGETPTPTAQQLKNTQIIKRALRKQGVPTGKEAVEEWTDLLTGACGCTSIEECTWALGWLFAASRDAKVTIKYYHHAGPLAAKCRRAVRDQRQPPKESNP